MILSEKEKLTFKVSLSVSVELGVFKTNLKIVVHKVKNF